VFHDIASGAETFAQFFELDELLTRNVQRDGCQFCGGRLDRADYPRKPRGLPEAAEPYFDRRFSLCCANQRCRRRTLPPSVRFLERHVYVGWVILEMCLAIAQTLKGEERRRVGRWRQWWRRRFGEGAIFAELRARHLSIAIDTLPGCLVAALSQYSVGKGALWLMSFVATGAAPPRRKSEG